MSTTYPIEGGCTCRAIRYQMLTAPMIVHCCHCRWCQRESGSSFALNAVIESSRVRLLSGEPEIIHTPSASGKGQRIHRCPVCKIAVWSNYAGAGNAATFIRVGTLDQPDSLPPDVHIFTMSKQPWVTLPAETPAFEEYYDHTKIWSKESLDRQKEIASSRPHG